MTDPIRLSKALMAQLGCSRREADLYIEGGWVTVDGQVVEAPQFKVSTQAVALLPGAVAVELPPVTVVLNALAGETLDTQVRPLDPARHWEGDASGVRLLRRHLNRHTLCLPLPVEAGGLQVLTQDRRVERKLHDDGHRLEQEYLIDFAGAMTTDALAQLNAPLNWRGREFRGHKVSLQSEARLRVALKDPAPGLLAHACAQAGLSPTSIRRIRIGGVPLLKLAAGQWRYLGPREKF